MGWLTLRDWAVGGPDVYCLMCMSFVVTDADFFYCMHSEYTTISAMSRVGIII